MSTKFNNRRADSTWLLVGCLSLLVCKLAHAEPPSKWQADDVGLKKTVTPFLTTHCLRCHGPKKQEGNLRVDQHLKADFLDPAVKAKWGELVNVLNSHEMPPEDEPQPKPDEVAAVVDWVTEQVSRAELIRRDGQIVLRRLNRDEYRNTIRDLIGLDFDVSAFPLDPPAGGFDNNGHALTMSPLLTELYLEAARKILDRVLVEPDSQQPPAIKWRFEIDSGDNDSNRVKYDGQSVIVNGGNNPVKDGFKFIHHENWDKHLNARGFELKHEGEYVIRIRAAGRVPSRDDVVESARKALQDRLDKQMKENPTGEKYHRQQFEHDLEHFASDRMYDYGPPRLKLIQTLGGQPKVVAEFDVDAPLEKPREYEIRSRFTTEQAGITIEYAYAIPKVLENFWFQGHDVFARPELYVDWFELEGPLLETWPPPSHTRLLGDAIPSKDDEREAAKSIFGRFMRQAYRRPVTDVEVADKLKLFDAVRADSPSFVAALKSPLIAIICSPHFVYLAEPFVVSPLGGTSSQGITKSNGDIDNRRKAELATATARTLSNHELAARLSYFLWSTMPDAELSQLADAGKLRDKATLTKQVNRLLADPKADAFVRNFAGQWLGLREVGANPPAGDLYPQYDRHLETSIIEESKAFFTEILKHDLNVLNFVGSDFVVINERLARFYGIPDVRGDHFRRVAVPKDIHRGGIVTQASMLTITSNGTRTSPVKRGTWVLKNVLGIDPGLPVANAGDIAPKVPGIDKATVRQRLEIHRTLPQCARCHNKIDPLGFALENFNAAGEWRDQEGFGYKGRVNRDDPKINTASKLPDGTAIDGVDELRTVLRQKEDLFLNCLASKLLTYALGRELNLADQSTVKAAVEHVKQNGYTLRSLVQFAILSEVFQTK